MHTCPDCGQACYCCGDIEDHDTGNEYLDVCEHHLECEDEISDGEIYADVSRRAMPEAHAELDKLIAEALKTPNVAGKAPAR